MNGRREGNPIENSVAGSFATSTRARGVCIRLHRLALHWDRYSSDKNRAGSTQYARVHHTSRNAQTNKRALERRLEFVTPSRARGLLPETLRLEWKS
jgi:hypothetical protein